MCSKANKWCWSCSYTIIVLYIWVNLKKLLDFHLGRKCATFMHPDNSMPFLQEPAADLQSKLDESVHIKLVLLSSHPRLCRFYIGSSYWDIFSPFTWFVRFTLLYFVTLLFGENYERIILWQIISPRSIHKLEKYLLHNVYDCLPEKCELRIILIMYLTKYVIKFNKCVYIGTWRR
jgi:hypothetical protein